MAFDREYPAQSVAVSSGYAYVAASYFRLHVIDLTNLALPVDLDGYPLDGYARAVTPATGQIAVQRLSRLLDHNGHKDRILRQNRKDCSH